MKKHQSHHVREETTGADDADKFWISDFFRFDQPFDSLKEDRETQGDKEDSINEGTQCLRPLPLLRARKSGISSSELQIKQISNPLTPYVYIFELGLWFATLTAHKPTHNDNTSFSYVAKI